VSFLLTLLLGYAALALQATWIPHLGIAGITPDLPLIATVLLALQRGPSTGTITGFLIGLGQDVANPGCLGLNALTKSITGYALGNLRERFDADTAPTCAATLFVSTLAHDLLYLAISTRLVLSDMLITWSTRTLPTAVYTAAAGTVLYLAIAAVTGRRGHRLGRSRLASR
jgi:rod shape-determining protein MreD